MVKQFLYKLKLISELIDESNWTDRENKIVEEHFKSLEQLLSEGKLILAGRTLNEDESMFGIVILQVANEEEARQIMLNDPAVKEGVMTSDLYPYHVALLNQNIKI